MTSELHCDEKMMVQTNEAFVGDIMTQIEGTEMVASLTKAQQDDPKAAAHKTLVSHRRSRHFEKLVRKIVPNKRSSKCPAPTPRVPLAPKLEVSYSSISGPTENTSAKWAPSADMLFTSHKAVPWKLYVPGIGLVSQSNATATTATVGKLDANGRIPGVEAPAGSQR
jgi:hypothetical protein